ncbi:MAG: hypothetical protein VX346_27200 [Planctomycetota bacterium]|nr:hypothetical protein [Planctomycetota bacterium]
MSTRIHASLSAPQLVDQLIDQLGTKHHNHRQEDEHDRYLKIFPTNHNLEKSKRICPSWMKGPGDPLFYWRTNRRFRGQEQVRSLFLRHRQEGINGQRIVTLRDDPQKPIEIPMGPAPP